MAYQINNVDVWACDISNRPGTLAQNLNALAEAGACLELGRVDIHYTQQRRAAN